MKARLRIRTLTLSFLLLPLAGCTDTLITNVAAGIRDGLITTTSGLIEDAINALFGLGDAAAEEGGNDAFINI